jgi:Zn-finger nucleic acid-binding protein
MDGLKVEHCEGCHGVLIQRHLFAMLVRDRRADFRGAEARPIPLDFDQLKLIVDCPGCKQAMEVHPYYGPGNIVIDSCSDCGLVWLDSGEMSRIEVAPGRR